MWIATVYQRVHSPSGACCQQSDCALAHGLAVRIATWVKLLGAHRFRTELLSKCSSSMQMGRRGWIGVAITAAEWRWGSRLHSSPLMTIPASSAVDLRVLEIANAIHGMVQLHCDSGVVGGQVRVSDVHPYSMALSCDPTFLCLHYWRLYGCVPPPFLVILVPQILEGNSTDITIVSM